MYIVLDAPIEMGTLNWPKSEITGLLPLPKSTVGKVSADTENGCYIYVGETPIDDGMRPEFKQAMDSYEGFMNEYCEFMKKYAESDGTDVGILADYASYMSKYVDVVEDFGAWDDGEMNTAETAYYLDVQTRVSKKLLEVAE